MASESMEFEKFYNQAGRMQFRLRAENGEIVAVGEDYVNDGDCDSTIKAIKSGASGAKVAEPVETTALDVSELAAAELEKAEKVKSTSTTGTTVSTSKK